MPSKGNPYPRRDSLSKNEPHHNPYAGGILRNILMGSDVKHIKSEAENSVEPKSIFEKRKSGLHAGEVRDELKGMTQFQTKMDSAERLDLADALVNKYRDTTLGDIAKHQGKERKEASLGGTREERLDATHRIKALDILKKLKEKK